MNQRAYSAKILAALGAWSCLLLPSMALAQGNSHSQTKIHWQPDLATARKQAAEFQVPLLIHFDSDHCLPCRTLEQRVYTNADLVGMLNKYFICYKVNGTKQPKVAADYNVHSFPSDVFLASNGKALHQGVCPQDARSYTELLTSVALLNRDNAIMLAKQSQPEQAQPTLAGNVQSQHAAANSNGAVAAQAAQDQSVQYMQAGFSQPYSQGANAQEASNYNSTSNFGAHNQSTSGQAYRPGAASTQGSATLSANPTNPASPYIQNHYENAQVQGQQFQQKITQAAEHTSLGASTSPTPSVQSGPLEYGQQAQAIAGGQNGLAGRYQPYADQRLANAQLPSLPAQAHAATNPNFARSAAGTQPQTIENPYYRAPTPNPQVANQNLPPSGATVRSGVPITMASSPAKVMQPGVTHSAQPPSYPAGLQMQSQTPENHQAVPSDSQTPSGLTWQPNSSPQTSPTTSTTTAQSTRDKVASQTRGIGQLAKPCLDGYCPVELAQNAAWVDGSQQYAIKHRGQVYHCSSQQALDTFRAAPDVYSPVLSGNDPLVLLEQGSLTPGDVRYILREKSSGALLLFSSAASKKKYWDDFSHYTGALGALLERARQN